MMITTTRFELQKAVVMFHQHVRNDIDTNVVFVILY